MNTDKVIDWIKSLQSDLNTTQAELDRTRSILDNERKATAKLQAARTADMARVEVELEKRAAEIKDLSEDRKLVYERAFRMEKELADIKSARPAPSPDVYLQALLEEAADSLPFFCTYQDLVRGVTRLATERDSLATERDSLADRVEALEGVVESLKEAEADAHQAEKTPLEPHRIPQEKRSGYCDVCGEAVTLHIYSRCPLDEARLA
jgi:uncharacterized protein (DUF3084 family)